MVLRSLAPAKWPNGALASRWKEAGLTEKVRAMAQESGKPAVECLLAVAAQTRTLPYDQVVLGFARGKDLAELVAKLVAMKNKWVEERKAEEEKKDLLRRAKEMGLRLVGPGVEEEPEAKPKTPEEAKPQPAILGPTGEQVAVVETAPKTPEAAKPKPKPVRQVTVAHRYQLWVGDDGAEGYADLGDLENKLEELLESVEKETAKPGDTATLTLTIKVVAVKDEDEAAVQDAERMVQEAEG
jgi:hypothetical protein